MTWRPAAARRRRAGRARRPGRCRGGCAAAAGRQASASAAQTGGRRGHDGELDRAVVGVLDIVGDQHHASCPGRPAAPARRGTGGTPARRPRARRRGRASALPQAAAPGGQVPREQRVVLREAGPGGERLLPDRAPEPLGQLDQGGPGAGVVGVGARRPARARGPRRAGGQLVDRRRVGGRAAAQRGGRGDAASSAGAAQSSLGTMTRAGPRPRWPRARPAPPRWARPARAAGW